MKGRYSLRDLPGLLRTRVGRWVLHRGLVWFAWYALAPIAALRRRLRLAQVPVVAISGTFGKTTTSNATGAALGVVPPPTNNRTFLATRLLRLGRRSPPALFEVGISRRGQMASYTRLLAPDVAVLTSVGTEHSTSIGTLEDVAREKRRLLDGLRPGGLAVLSADDPRVRAMAGGPATRAVRFGFAADADVRAEALRIDWPHGTRFELVVPEGRFDAFVRPLGRPAVTAALAAVAVARELGVPVETALARLAQGFAPAPGRLEPVALPGGAWALRDDFKAQLEPIETALDLLAAIPARRRLLVLGPITEPPRPIRTTYRRLGERLAPVVDRLIGCGPFRGRFEELAAAARRAGLAAAAISFEPTVAGAAETLRGELGPGDVVLLKGQKNVRLERIVLALGGRRVGCDLVRCFVKTVPCTSCPMLEPGWEGRRAVT